VTLFLGAVYKYTYLLTYCYKGDVSFLQENRKFDPCKIETIYQIDTQFVNKRNIYSKFGEKPFTGPSG